MSEEIDTLCAKLAAANESVALLERQLNEARRSARAWKRSAKMWRSERIEEYWYLKEHYYGQQDGANPYDYTD